MKNHCHEKLGLDDLLVLVVVVFPAEGRLPPCLLTSVVEDTGSTIMNGRMDEHLSRVTIDRSIDRSNEDGSMEFSS